MNYYHSYGQVKAWTTQGLDKSTVGIGQPLLCFHTHVGWIHHKLKFITAITYMYIGRLGRLRRLGPGRNVIHEEAKETPRREEEN